MQSKTLLIATALLACLCGVIANVRFNSLPSGDYPCWLPRVISAQRYLQQDTPVNYATYIGSHNSFSSAYYRRANLPQFLPEGYYNQEFNITQQLNWGARWIELDLHYTAHPDFGTDDIRICHTDPDVYDICYATPFNQDVSISCTAYDFIDYGVQGTGCLPVDPTFDVMLTEINDWLDNFYATEYDTYAADERSPEVVLVELDTTIFGQGLDTATENRIRNDIFATIANHPIMSKTFNRSSIVDPSARPVIWPTPNEMQAIGKSVVFITTINGPISDISFNPISTAQIASIDTNVANHGRGVPRNLNFDDDGTCTHNGVAVVNGDVATSFREDLIEWFIGPIAILDNKVDTGIFLPNTTQACYRCGIIPKFDRITAIKMAEHLSWSFEQFEPQPGLNTLMRWETGRWSTSAWATAQDDPELRACRQNGASNGGWQIANSTELGMDCPAGHTWDIPRNAFDNNALWQLAKSLNHDVGLSDEFSQAFWGTTCNVMVPPTDTPTVAPTNPVSPPTNAPVQVQQDFSFDFFKFNFPWIICLIFLILFLVVFFVFLCWPNPAQKKLETYEIKTQKGP